MLDVAKAALSSLLLGSDVASTPPLGFSTWNSFRCDFDAALLRHTADLMVSTGLRDAGYIYLVSGTGWLHINSDILCRVNPTTRTWMTAGCSRIERTMVPGRKSPILRSFQLMTHCRW